MNNTGHPFTAYLFNPELGNEVIEGQIFLAREEVVFRAGEDLREEIPSDRLSLRYEVEGERICFDDRSRPQLKLYTLDHEVLDDHLLPQMSRFRNQVYQGATRREMKRRMRLLFYFVLACVLVTVLTSWAVGAMVKSVAKRVPREWEQAFGRSMIEKLRAKGLIEDNPVVSARLAQFAEPLIRSLPPDQRDLKFYVIRSEIPNAFALPGGYVVVHTGLVDLVDRPEELLGVLAHEIAHVTQKHHARKILSAAGPFVIFGVFLHSGNSTANILTAGSGVVVFQGFSQQFESEADRVGWGYLVDAGIDPRGMIGVFKKLQVYEQVEMPLKLPQALSSHPALENRIAALQRLWENQPKKTGFLEFTNGVPKVDDSPPQPPVREPGSATW